MNAQEMADLAALVDRIDNLLKQFVAETSPERLSVLRAEVTEATDKLKRAALRFQN
jgi:ElaB/YqjD/DUF883 family membrane-anchored ribosome-binding protein